MGVCEDNLEKTRVSPASANTEAVVPRDSNTQAPRVSSFAVGDSTAAPAP
jgi:hypothetical protein